jgi:hypothetical protein
MKTRMVEDRPVSIGIISNADDHPLRPSNKKRKTMNLEKVVFAFFIVFAATLNFGFFLGDIERPELHNVYELFAAIVVNMIATVLKFGDRTQIGAVHLSTSLVADIQLIAAAVTWAVAMHVTGNGMTPEMTASVVSLSGGALLANIISVVMLIVETVMMRR